MEEKYQNYLAELRVLSQKVKDGGVTGEGAINYILDEFVPTKSFEESLNKKRYILRDVVISVLEAVPSLFQKDNIKPPAEEQSNFIKKIESRFTIKIDRIDIYQIIGIAELYELMKKKEIKAAEKHREFYENR